MQYNFRYSHINPSHLGQNNDRITLFSRAFKSLSHDYEVNI